MLPAIFGLAGERLSRDERAFFRDADPAGYILFARNCCDPDQLRALTDSLRDLAGRDRLAILVDQEGGRVARLKPPHWPEFPAAGVLARKYRTAPMSMIEAARLNGMAIAAALTAAGIGIATLPVLDLRGAGTHTSIGDRALGGDPMQVAALGRALLAGLAAGGVAGMVKHIPGQGRAVDDSHETLPVVDAPAVALERDIAPFRRLADAPAAIVAHLLYTAWDDTHCASRSPTVISEVIRGRIGFGGLLVSDDIGMGALTGCVGERAATAVSAGCDAALHCSSDLAEAELVAAALPPVSAAARARLDRATPLPVASAADANDLAARRDALLAAVPD
jgi:beta-N-acetylhexosaminidase